MVSVRAGRKAVRRSPRRVLVGMALGAVTSVSTACYQYVPILGSTPQVGDRVALQVSDEGRVSLRDQFGPGVDRVEGLLLENGGDQYVVSVSKVRTIRGETSHWTGERVRIPQTAVARVHEQKFSRKRTIMAVSGAALAAVAFVASRSLIGFGNSGDPPPPGGPPPDQ